MLGKFRTHHVGHNGLLYLQALQRLLATQMQLIGICRRYKDNTMFACLQDVGNNQLPKKKIIRERMRSVCNFEHKCGVNIVYLMLVFVEAVACLDYQ